MAAVAQVVQAIRRQGRVEGFPRRMDGGFPIVAQPDLQREEYLRELNRYVARAHAAVRQHLLPVLADMPAPERTDARARFDATVEERIRAALEKAARALVAAIPVSSLARIVSKAAGDTSAFQRLQMRKTFRETLGIDLFAILDAEPNLRPLVKKFTKENIALIKSVASRYFGQLQTDLLDGVRRGIRPESLARIVQERTGVAYTNAKRIANDQVGKFYGALNHQRQVALGVKRYRWRTVNDNRVRESHRNLSGEEFSWDNPPSEGHPGHPVNCRCWPEPILDDLLAMAQQPATAKERTPAPRAPRVPKAPPPPPPGPALVHGPVRGDGAAVAAAFPRLAELLGDTLRVDDFADATVREEVESLQRVPEGLLEAMRPLLGDIHISTKNITDMGRSGRMAANKGVQPRGWAPGSTWELVGGAYNPNSREVLVATRSNGASVGSVTLHEFGHAVDHLLAGGRRASDDPEFRAAYAKFIAGDHAQSKHPYLNQPGAAGPSETFAEAFSGYFTKGPGSSTWDFGPDIVRFMRDRYGHEKYPPRPAPKRARRKTP